MTFFRKQQPSRIFRLQQGTGASVGSKHVHNEIEHFLSSASTKNGSARPAPALNSCVSSKRFRTVTIVAIVCILCFAIRSIQLQIVNGQHYQELATKNRYQTELVVPLRGRIFDRDGEQLAWNEPAFILTMTISKLPRGEDERNGIFYEVSKIIGLNPIDLELLYSLKSSTPHDPVPVIDSLDYDAAMRIAVDIASFDGFELKTKNKRLYTPTIPSLSHVLGFTGGVSVQDLEEYSQDDYRLIDDVGKSGIERWYETQLRGTPGKLIYEVDARGRRLSIVSKENPIQGADITLCIDGAFQKYIAERLDVLLRRIGAQKGAVIAMDPASGKIRALVSLPTFDSNDFIGGIDATRYAQLLEDPAQPLFPRAIAGEYPSGSIFKPFVAYAALAEKIVGEHSSFVSTGGVRIGQWFFPDWKEGGHGVTDVRKAIAESVNTYFYIIGGGLDQVTGLGVERISDYARRFGFGSKTGIDLPGETDGFLPSKEWKESVKGERWYVGDTYHYAIGQGDFLTTPLQMAVATSVIANGGYKVTPSVVEGEVLVEPIDGLNEEALRVVREGMRQTVSTGSARSLNGLAESVAGKTGTAQTPGDLPFHSWFTGFAPYENPTLTLVVLIEEGGESTDAAVPLARELFSWWFLYGK
jgi:penicillin-binding protein 2